MLIFRLSILTLLATVALSANIGHVSALRGDVKITRGIALYQAHKSLEIEEKDTFFTSSNGSMQITFSDNTVITLGKNSVFKVEEYLYSEKDKKDNNAKFKFRKGFFKSITGRIGKLAPKNFTIKTKNSTIGVRGTEITGTSNNEIEDIVCTHGKISVTSQSTAKTYIAVANEHVKIKLDPKLTYVVATATDVLIQHQIKAGLKKESDPDVVNYIKEEMQVIMKPEVKKELIKKGIKIDEKKAVIPEDIVIAPKTIKSEETNRIENNFLLDKPEFKSQPELRKEIKEFTKQLSAEELSAIEAAKAKAEEDERLRKEKEAQELFISEKKRVKEQQEALERQRNTYQPKLPKVIPEEKVTPKKDVLKKDIKQMDQILDTIQE